MGKLSLSLSLGRSAHSDVSFKDIGSIKALTAAWQKFSRGKKSRQDVAEFHKNLQNQLQSLHSALQGGSYQHERYQQFIIQDPKTRQIHKACVKDRVVHQAIVNAIEPLFESRFIYDSYSCRVGKGTHKGIERLQTFLRRASHNDTRQVYVLKCDIRKYFASIDHEILLMLLARHIKDEEILELLRSIILSHGAETGKGIPLGNVTSQLFANIYLHELDWYMKQTLGVTWYGRYCDDFVVISTDKGYLIELVEVVRRFLAETLQLELHPDKVSIRSWRQGVDFLGYVLRPHTVTLRTKTRRRATQRTNENNLSSYLGLCSHAQAYRLSLVLQLIAWQR